tara:strand:- start:191 stop:1354 length:1164 start_codon:yes stop_codon:yes gene_type:complete
MNNINISNSMDEELINVIKTFIDDMNIKISNKNISKFIYENINKSISEINNINHDYILKDSIFNNSISETYYFDKRIINNIYKNLHYVYNVTFFYKNINFYVNIYFKEKINIDEYIKYIKLIICICLRNIAIKEKDIFIFDLYLTDEKKHFAYKFPNCIESYNINSGYSRFSDNMYICIYRKEEWIKVFIHECLHTFNLDFHDEIVNYKNMFSSTFNCSSDYNVNESFVELWARIINCGLFTYFMKKNITYGEFEKIFELNINIEAIYSIIQGNRLLNCFDINYNSIINKGKKNIVKNIYKEKTNALCYYIITSILLFNFEKSINWFNMGNDNYLDCIKKEREIIIFCYFIKEMATSKKLISFYEKIHKLKLQKFSDFKMSIFDIEL